MSPGHNDSHNDNQHEKADLGPLYLPPESVSKLSTPLLGVGALFLLATFAAAAGALGAETQRQALFSYLVAFFFVVTLAVGGLFFTVLQHLVGAVWSVSVRRISEVLGAMTPLLAVL